MMSDEILTTAEAAAATGLKPRTIQDWAARFNLGRRIAGRLVFTPAEVEIINAGDHKRGPKAKKEKK
jgi:hypothetical protein